MSQDKDSDRPLIKFPHSQEEANARAKMTSGARSLKIDMEHKLSRSTKGMATGSDIQSITSDDDRFVHIESLKYVPDGGKDEIDAILVDAREAQQKGVTPLEVLDSLTMKIVQR